MHLFSRMQNTRASG